MYLCLVTAWWLTAVVNTWSSHMLCNRDTAPVHTVLSPTDHVHEMYIMFRKGYQHLIFTNHPVPMISPYSLDSTWRFRFLWSHTVLVWSMDIERLIISEILRIYITVSTFTVILWRVVFFKHAMLWLSLGCETTILHLRITFIICYSLPMMSFQSLWYCMRNCKW
jgi:hypothetical protein